MKKIPKRYWWDLGGSIALLIAYSALFAYCANHDIVAAMLSGGPKSSSVAIAALFIAMRVFVILILPGCILARVGLLLNHLCFSEDKNAVKPESS
ncbi:MAG: hypothetical protein GXP32_09785 [Kiritimatiellaeota bacterium]|nr:hypothetical protein [Kiritimatiellota bacterium]